eukprot:COSAG02_NODE_4791_length_4974_cov_403.213333_1_plen_30_part_10
MLFHKSYRISMSPIEILLDLYWNSVLFHKS